MNSKLPNQITVANGNERSGSVIQKNGGKTMLACSVPLPGVPTVGVGARGGPKPTSEFVLRVPNLDGDAKRIHEGFILVRAKEGPTYNGEEKCCISLHLSACIGVTSCEREMILGLRERVQRRLFEMLIFYGGMMTWFALSVPPS
jgi:hypothetical protein